MVSSKGVTRLMRRRIAAGATGNEAAATRRFAAGLIVIRSSENTALKIRRLRHAARDEEAEDRRLRKPRGKHPPSVELCVSGRRSGHLADRAQPWMGLKRSSNMMNWLAVQPTL